MSKLSALFWLNYFFKGLVHPKILILSLITLISYQTRKTLFHLWNTNNILMKSKSSLILHRTATELPPFKAMCHYFCLFFAHKKYSRSFVKLRLNHWCHRTILTMSLLPFWALNVGVHLLSIQGQKVLGFHKKYLHLWSEDERSYGFGTTWGWVINDRPFHLWVNYPFKAETHCTYLKGLVDCM